ncbi:hypothetical protein SLEP1_g5553 [Rubroshorea leprosula]|uniref:Uncharacterized protein n=1 Tax=Rubroshorea leprosula TaxID=152421 RepID=A0AAV5I0A9_9ROSI|nr:hypothetical protein SLEP1_g5553 [Rubroshorea leprosula]
MGSSKSSSKHQARQQLQPTTKLPFHIGKIYKEMSLQFACSKEIQE